MHECPQCWSICYCDLDDSNDCRDDGECFHACDPEDDDLDYGAEDEEPARAPAARTEGTAPHGDGG